jgi:phosphoenolpyruvate carboxykinase-like protein
MASMMENLGVVAEGVYDGLTLGAEATFAAVGVHGQLRYDPMSLWPFMADPRRRVRRALAAAAVVAAQPPR